MIETLENIYSFLIPLIAYSFGIAFLGFILLLFSNMIEKTKIIQRKIQITGGILFGQLFLLGLSLVFLQTTILRKIRNEFIEILENPKSQIIQIDKNFGEFSSNELKNELLKIYDYSAHHSGISDETKLKIITPEKIINLRIYRDTQNYNEYWIFTDQYEFGNNENEIGRIKTTKFR